MPRLLWAIIGLAGLAVAAWASLLEGRDFWPYALAARGAILGAAIYGLWLGRTRRVLEFNRAWRAATLTALAATAWCCIPVNGGEARPWIEAATGALGAAVALGGMSTLALLGAAHSWGLVVGGSEPS